MLKTISDDNSAIFALKYFQAYPNLLSSTPLDTELVKVSQVCKAWRELVLQRGTVRKRIKQLFESRLEANFRRILAWKFDTVDDIMVLCYTLRFEREGAVYGWGSEPERQPNFPARNAQSLPTEITKFRTVADIVAGHHASFVVKDARLKAIGFNAFDRLGLKYSGPPQVTYPSSVGVPPIKSLANSSSVSFAVDLSGRLWSWGDNQSGTLGRNHQGSGDEMIYDGKPLMIDTLKNCKIKQVACGGQHACCLTTDGVVFTWGHKDFVGQGELDSDVGVPKKLNIEKICQISCGVEHTLLLSADKKTVWAFGSNCHGQLGQGPEIRCEKTPAKVPFFGEKIILKLQCYGDDSAILSADGQIKLWGRFWNSGNRDSPRLVNIQRFVDISMGNCFMLALTSDNRLYAFGRNNHGQCGQGSTSEFIDKLVEVKNLDNLHIKQISAGYDHCLIKCAKI